MKSIYFSFKSKIAEHNRSTSTSRPKLFGYHCKRYLLRYLDVYVYKMALSPLGDSFVKMNVTFHRKYTEGELDLLQDILHT